MVNILKMYSDFKSKSRIKEKEGQREELIKTFGVVEKENIIYIVCNNVAVYKATPSDTIESLLLKIKDMRDSLLSYNKF